MGDPRGMDAVRQFFPGTGRTYDRIVNLCTFGFDRRWKRKMIGKIPAGSLRIMDQACGTGILTFRIVQRFPHAQVVGVDVTDEYLAVAKQKAAARGLTVEFLLGRAEDLLPGRIFDCITSSYLAKYAVLATQIPNIREMLRDGGTLIMHDFTYPPNRLFALLWELYFKILQTAGSWKYPQWKPAFDGLPALVRETAWVAELVGVLQENGFSGITVDPLTLGTSTIVSATRDRAPLMRHPTSR